MTRQPRATPSIAAIRGHDDGYLAFHAPRYAFLLERLAAAGITRDTRLLDVGLSNLTRLVQERFGCRVDSLGFGVDHDTAWGRHRAFDLNDSQDPARWRRDLPRYDVVIMAEVIEHLHTAPELVLGFIRSLLEDGGLLILQTPNATGFSKRLKMLLGHNPFDRIRLDPTDPGHFREYTRAELESLLRGAGFAVQHTAFACYFDMRFGLHTATGNQPRPVRGAIKNWLYALLPPFLRYGISMECRALP